MSSLIKVAVLMGGPSSEHEVSMASGKNMIAALNSAKYVAKPVKITKDGSWLVPEGFRSPTESLDNAWNSCQPVSTQQALVQLIQEETQVAALALHGEFGEDGTIQGLLEACHLPYTGSNILGSSLAMDKLRSQQLYRFHGLNVPRYQVFSEGEEEAALAFAKQIGWPCVVKPVAAGSSVATFIPRAEEEFKANLAEGWRRFSQLMVQQYIDGKEVTCGVLDTGGEPLALPLTEIIPQTSTFFDYQAKYTPGASQEITPAKLDSDLFKTVQRLALQAHHILGCDGYSRSDFIIHEDTVYILETNTLPGMTDTSLLPQGAQAMGISFPELIDRIVSHGQQRFSTRHEPA